MRSELKRSLVSGTAAVAVALVAWGAAGAQDREPEARMSRGLVAAACAFEHFMQEAAGLDAAFADKAAVDKAAEVSLASDPQQLETGMIAFAAMTALQEPAFVAGVREAADQAGSPDALAQRLAEDPDAALALPGADLAAARAAAALAREAEPLVAAGGRIRQAAYDVQRQDWSRAWANEPGARLARAKQVSAPQGDPNQLDTARLFRAVLHAPAEAAPAAVVAPPAPAGQGGAGPDPLANGRTPVERGPLGPAAQAMADDEAAWGMTERARAGGPRLLGGPGDAAARRLARNGVDYGDVADDRRDDGRDYADVQDLRRGGGPPALDAERGPRDEFAGLRRAAVETRAAAAPASPVIARALALAAQAMLGHAGEHHEAGLKSLVSESKSADCLRMAKLNTYQCLAVAGPEYENIYCLGQHALADAGRCVAEASGLASHAPPADVNDVAVPVAGGPQSRDVGVPVARAEVR